MSKRNAFVYPGRLFSFRDGVLYDISVDATRVPAAREPLPPAKPPGAEAARVQIVAELQQRIAALGDPRGAGGVHPPSS